MLKRLRTKGPLRLAIEGCLIAGFMGAIVTRGNFAAAGELAIVFGVLFGLLGLVLRAGQRHKPGE
ncbi:MAG: hypothetical protein ACRDLM_10910 [Gaiellaceae bacterium]